MLDFPVVPFRSSEISICDDVQVEGENGRAMSTSESLLSVGLDAIAGKSSPYATPKNRVSFVARCRRTAKDPAPDPVPGPCVGETGSSERSLSATEVDEAEDAKECGECGECGLWLAQEVATESAEGDDGECRCRRDRRPTRGIGGPIGRPPTVGLGVRGTELEDEVDVEARGDTVGAA